MTNIRGILINVCEQRDVDGGGKSNGSVTVVTNKEKTDLQVGLGSRRPGFELEGQQREQRDVNGGRRGVPEGPRHPKLQQIV